MRKKGLTTDDSSRGYDHSRVQIDSPLPRALDANCYTTQTIGLKYPVTLTPYATIGYHVNNSNSRAVAQLDLDANS